MFLKNIILHMYNMDQFNLLYLDNDILNIIGDYVKADNLDRISNEKLKQDILEYVDVKRLAGSRRWKLNCWEA
jgi:hypothetical protein